jgi:hypothetical protein
VTKKKVERVERRRPHIGLNLIGEAKTRSAKASRGCAALLSRLLIDAMILVLLMLGLS